MRRALIILVLLGAAGGAGWWWYATHAQTEVAEAGRGRGRGGANRGRRGGPDPEQPIPVTAARAEAKDVPIFLDALGTVQAFNTVNVRAMIDGPLTEIRFHEGEDVHGGDVLARIDPRPYQASLDSAAAKKQQDEATLANNRLDFARYTKLAPTLGSSQQQLDTAKYQVATEEALVRADQAAIDTAPHQPQLHDCHGADRWPGRHPAGGYGQHRPLRGCDADGGDHPAEADLGDLHPAAAGAGRRRRGDAGGRARRAGAVWRERRKAARPRQAGRAGQPGRCRDGHDQAEGDLSERGADLVARAGS